MVFSSPLIQYNCYSCGSDSTYIEKGRYPRWRMNRDEVGNILNMLCQSCFGHLIYHPKWNPVYNAKFHKRRYLFKNRTLLHNGNPRKGICSQCGKTNCKTDLHHDRYDPNNPLMYTRELCVACHRRTRMGRK